MGDERSVEEREFVRPLAHDVTESDDYDDMVVRWIFFKKCRLDFLDL